MIEEGEASDEEVIETWEDVLVSLGLPPTEVAVQWYSEQGMIQSHATNGRTMWKSGDPDWNIDYESDSDPQQ